MPNETPLDILLSEYGAESAEVQAVEAVAVSAAAVPRMPEVKALSDLQTPVYGNDPKELIKHRFLYRGGIALLCGPTGIGKSSFLMQLAIYLAAGQALFGIEPGDTFAGHGMKILLIQAENDEGDLAEMRDGVLAGCETLTPEQKALACANIKTITLTDKTSDKFAGTLALLLDGAGPFDLVLVDPAFAYLGGDSNSQRDVSHFMRELLNPLVQAHGVGLILAHHTNKPLRGKEKEGWAAGDYAYLGAGSAEWINPARAALAIRSVGSESVFELRAAKRGKRLRWTDAEGAGTTVQHIAHHGEPGVICWRSATPEEVAEVTGGNVTKVGRPKKYLASEALHAVKDNPGQSENGYRGILAKTLGCSSSQAKLLLTDAVAKKWLTTALVGGSRRYSLTAAGQSVAGRTVAGPGWGASMPETLAETG